MGPPTCVWEAAKEKAGLDGSFRDMSVWVRLAGLLMLSNHGERKESSMPWSTHPPQTNSSYPAKYYMWSPAALGLTWGNRHNKWQTLQVTDIQHNYVSFCALERERDVSIWKQLWVTTACERECVWGMLGVLMVSKFAVIQQVPGRKKPNELIHWFITQISQISSNLRLTTEKTNVFLNKTCIFSS